MIFSGSFSFVLAEKLKALKAILKTWNREVFGRVEVKKSEVLSRVSYWDEKENDFLLTVEETEARNFAREDYKYWSLLEEISWRHKSRELLLKEGDKNTSFFHRMANSHRRRNCIKKVRVNGNWVEDEDSIKREVAASFQCSLSDPGGWRPCLSGLNFKDLGRDAADSLEVPFTVEEVFAALSDLNGDKAPGPDGFPIAFWLFCWDFVKEEVMGFFKDFFEHNKFVRNLNSTFLVLIPKKENAVDINDFRPISLVGGLYKVLAKVLANRLKRVVRQVVSIAQNAFVEGRQILDAVLIADEAVDAVLKRKEKGLICKLDIEKAYDHLQWNFLLGVMEKMGFRRKWLNWIKWCISTASFSVLVNGTPSGFFRSSRGLRQGDPLSPYLFVLGMEALSGLIERAVQGGFLSGCYIGRRNGEGMVVSHLLYADDTLLFCRADQEQLAHLSWLLMWFESISGLRINLNKSKIISVGSIAEVDSLALDLGCKVGTLPSSYLGLPLGAPYNSVTVWDGIEERFRKRLALWKRQYISKGGRITLIRSTLSSLPIYFMSLFRMPRRVRLRLEQIQRGFL